MALWKLRILAWDKFFALVGYPPPIHALSIKDREIYRKGLRVHNEEYMKKITKELNPLKIER